MSEIFLIESHALISNEERKSEKNSNEKQLEVSTNKQTKLRKNKKAHLVLEYLE